MTGRALPAALLAAALAGGCKSSSRPPSLAESVSVEQPGGSVAQLFSQGSEIPTSATESFTTAKDDEKRLFIHVLRGAGRSAGKLHEEGWWAIDGIAPAKAGEPQVMVTFELDAKGDLSLSARLEEKRLSAKKLDKVSTALAPSPLSEPDEDEDADEDPE